MEFVVPFLGPVLTEPCRKIYGYIHSRTKNFFSRRSNVSSLKNKMTSLMDLRDVVRQENRRLRDEDQAKMDDWLVQVDKFEKDVDELVSTISATDEKNFMYSCILCPKLCKLSSQLVRKIQSLEELKETGKLLEKMDYVSLAEHIPAPSITSQETASENLDRLLDLLMNDSVTRIGVWGMGGIGKTTLVKNLNNELEKRAPTRDFGMVVWVTVSKETNISRIQMQIAERLKMEAGINQSEERMAVRLHQRLRNEKCFLLILDDVWQAVDLDCVGIPRPEICTMGKIIITSRSLDVCREMMTQVDLRVKSLNPVEAWKLFREHAGEVVLEEGILPIAKVVANECDGLPLAIIVAGASMRGKYMVPLWKNAVRELQSSEPLGRGMEDKVYKTLKWSYDSLQSKQTKYCFLFCCLYPEDYDIDINELVRYWYCEGLLDERLDYEERENQGIAIIQSLKDCCLLEPSEYVSSVKMHDVVRDVGIWIASSVEDECKSLARSGIGWDRVSESEFSCSYNRLSFINNKIGYLPDGVVRCPEASTLLLQGNTKLKGISASFLQGFETLKILDLSFCMIEYLPSLAQLNQLRALILMGCFRLLELPPLDDLSRLLVLDCSDTDFKQLPNSIEKVCSLRQLDVSNSNLQAIPYGAISMMPHLELLRLSRYWNAVQGQRLFEILPLLKKLVVFSVDLDDIPRLSDKEKFNWIGSIRKFEITISKNRSSPVSLRLEHYIDWYENRVTLDRLSLSREYIGWLLCKATYCALSSCDGITQMFRNSFIYGSFASLKVLRISDCKDTFQADTIGCANVPSFDLLPNLEAICIQDVDELESISDLSKILGLRFKNPRIICVAWCPKLKFLLSLEENQMLENIKTIAVTDCEMLQCFFNYQQMDLDLVLPKLETVRLEDLPNLENLCRNHECWPNLQVLDVYHCHGIKKLPLNVQNTHSINKIRGEREWWEQLEWDSEDTKIQLQKRFHCH